MLGGASVLFGQAAQPARPAPAATRAPLFTEAQAASGKALYEKTCAACHGATLSGGTAPPLTGPAFQASWRDPRVTLDDLFFIIRTTMPPRAPETLTPQEHASVFAYILTRERISIRRLDADGKFGRSQAPASSGGSAPPPAARAPGAARVHRRRGRRGSQRRAGPDQATLTAAARSTDWLFHTHDYAGTRFSPLDQINASNAARLAPACMFQVGERDNFQTGPVVHNGTMYVTTMASTIALDAATCRVKWRHTWQARRRHRAGSGIVAWRSRTAASFAGRPTAICWP